MTLKPIGQQILIHVPKKGENVQGGLYLPADDSGPMQGVIKALGSGQGPDGLKPFEVCLGDKVLLGRFSGSLLKLDGETYLITREEDILAVVT